MLQKRFKQCAVIILLATGIMAAPNLAAQRYVTGDIVENFSLTDRATGQPVSLYDLEGKVVFLEWFAWWCPFCQAAAAQVEEGIVGYYEGVGNANGVPVVHVALNLQANQESQTQGFVDAYNLGTVLEDFDRGLANRFQSGGQPIFAIINGVANSPSHQQWQLVYSRLGYGDLDQPIQVFRNFIDSVSASDEIVEELPTINVHPENQTVPAGSNVVLGLEADGGQSPMYQWFKDGMAIAGEMDPTLVLDSVEEGDDGFYSVRISNGAGEVESRSARLVVDVPVQGQIVNLSIRTKSASDGNPLTVGFGVTGGSKDILIRAVGPTLSSAFGLPSVLPDPAITLFVGQDEIGMNDNWINGDRDALEAAFASIGAFDLDTSGLDAALLEPLEGVFTARVTDSGLASGTVLVELYDSSRDSSRLINVSARNTVGSGQDVLVLGFVISGNEPKKILIRGIGPSLSQFGLSGVLQDPVLRLFQSINGINTEIALNNDWGDEFNADEANAVPGPFLLEEGSKDSMLLIELPAGAFTAQLSGVDGMIGTALVEVYDAQ